MCKKCKVELKFAASVWVACIIVLTACIVWAHYYPDQEHTHHE